MAAAAKEVGQAATAKPAKSGVSLVVVILLFVIALGGGGGVAYFVASKSSASADADAAPGKGKKGAKAESKKAPIAYLPLEPAFVVNLADEDALRYLQLEVQLASRDAGAKAALDAHNPVIRNNLILLFSQQRSFDLRDRGGKERLQKAALEEVKKVLKAEKADADIEALYFTSFVTQ
jgi:flagellar protein FliL